MDKVVDAIEKLGTRNVGVFADTCHPGVVYENKNNN